MPLEVIENITRVEADNRERKASAEAKAKQIVADAQREGLALLQQTRTSAAERSRELLQLDAAADLIVGRVVKD